MVLAETGYWLALANRRDQLSRLGAHAKTRFIEQIASNVELHELAKAHLGTIQALMEKPAPTRFWWTRKPAHGRCGRCRFSLG